jgi:glycosyltransferase involved in cell wall biosynthesis
MKLSIVIPAYNEEKRIGDCLQSVFLALKTVAHGGKSGAGWDAEVIVVDNNSTDKTADIARNLGVEVIFEPVNHIARARNAGAARATGDWILFLDADTILPAETLRDALAAMESGKAVGGSSILNYGEVTGVTWVFVKVVNFVIRHVKMTAGCFIFCRADAFRELGGFNQEYFAGEDAELGKAMKQWGRARGLPLSIMHRHPVLTSDRKFHLYGWGAIALAVGRYVLAPKRTMRDKRYLDLFYDGKR